MSLSDDIGLRLKKIRLEKDMKIAEVAEKANIAQSSLSYIENGTNSPSVKTFEAICNALGVKPSNIFTDPNAEAVQKIDDALEDQDPELLEFWLETKKRPDLQIFLKQVKSVSPKAIRQMMAIIKAIEDEEENE